jgi:hypothetical protein
VLALAAVAVAASGLAAVAGRASRPTPLRSTVAPLLVVDAQRRGGGAVSPLLFGLSVDLPAQTYVQPGDRGCAALAGAGRAVTLVRVGAATADSYDWRTDSYAPLQRGRAIAASAGCVTPPHGPGATVLRVLDRARALRARAVVVLNGEVDDPQGAAGLVRLVVQRYGLGFARRIDWEIGNAPAAWQHFGVPLLARQRDEHITCSPDQYAALVTSYAAAIAAALGGADPQRRWPVIVADEWIANATDQSWTGVVTAVDTQYYPFSSPGLQPATAAEVAQSVAGLGRAPSTGLDQRLFGLRANLSQYNAGRDLSVFVGAWSVDANASFSNPANPLYGSSAEAVFVARLLMHLARDGVAMAAWAPPLYTSAQAPFTASGEPTAGYRVLAALRVLADAHLLTLRGRPGIDGLAARLADGRIAVVLANATGKGAITLHVGVRGGTARPVGATVQTFAPAAPGGLTTRRTLSLADARVSVPALGIVLMTVRAH